jgi:hypothetical protein
MQRLCNICESVNGFKAIVFASRSMTKSERKYCVTRKELLAAVYFTKYFPHYLLGRKFVIRSDHSLLRWLLNFKEPEYKDCIT